MTQQVDSSRLADMRDHAEEAIEYCKDMDMAAFLADTKTKRAVTYLIQIIGEAANRISGETRSRIDLPWSDIIGMRNILVHAYHGVDDEILWNAVQVELPDLLRKLSEV